MTNTLHLEDRHWEIIKRILKQANVDFYAFGSRVKGTHKKFSDLDLCYKEPLDPSVKEKIEIDFSESDLPFFVELIDYKSTRPGFKENIAPDLIKLDLYS